MSQLSDDRYFFPSGSGSQTGMFTKLFPEGTARPTQPLNSRELLLDMTP